MTLNPDTIYFMPFFTPRTQGRSCWRFPTGGRRIDHRNDHGQLADGAQGCRARRRRQGQGLEHLFPPDYKDKVPKGYIALPSGILPGLCASSLILKSRSDADIAKAVAYGKRIKLCNPLSRAAKPPKTRFVDAINVVVSSVIPYDVRFFQSLNRMVEYEPGLERDRAMIYLAQVAWHRKKANRSSLTRRRPPC